MDDQKPTIFIFKIDNLWEKEGPISSPKFSSGGCKWFVKVCPNGYHFVDGLSLHLKVANPESLPLGWKGKASYSFALLNQSGKEVYKTPEYCKLFRPNQFTGWGSPQAFSVKTLQDRGLLEKNKLILKLTLKVIAEGDEMLYSRGFNVLYSQLPSLNRLFAEHPDIAVNLKLQSQSEKTIYMNLLLRLIEKLDNPPNSFSEVDLCKARRNFIDLTEAGFKLDWLKIKLDEISLERKLVITDGSNVQYLKELFKNLNLELETEKVKSATCAANVLSLEQTVSDLRAELSKKKVKLATSAATVLSLEQMVSDQRVELSKEKDKSAATVLSLEEMVLDLRAELSKEKDKSAATVSSLEQTVSDLRIELSKEKDRSAVTVLSLEQMVSDLRAELSKEKDKSSAPKDLLEGDVHSWEVLDYADLTNENVE